MIAFSVSRTTLNASTRKLIHAGIIIRQMSRLTGLSKTLKTCWYNGMAKKETENRPPVSDETVARAVSFKINAKM